MIAAMAHNRVIGANNGMPWHLPADLAHFKRITLGKPVVMGRKTYQSIGKALPGRHNIVVTTDPDYSLPDATVVNSCEQAVEAVGKVDELMVIGGGTIYRHFLPLCDCLYLTEIDLTVEGDTHFPDYNSVANWTQIATEAHQPDEKNKHAYRFITLHKVG
ncbi:type 3 dihydrofolate reductase [Aliiglaciecola litoralis]